MFCDVLTVVFCCCYVWFDGRPVPGGVRADPGSGSVGLGGLTSGPSPGSVGLGGLTAGPSRKGSVQVRGSGSVGLGRVGLAVPVAVKASHVSFSRYTAGPRPFPPCPVLTFLFGVMGGGSGAAGLRIREWWETCLALAVLGSPE